MLHKKTLAAIKAHALAEYPRECCGLIVAVGRREVYRPCCNQAQGLEQFRMSAEDWANAEDAGRVLAVVHSHPDHAAQPSDADRAACEATGLPWVIVSVRDGDIAEVHQFAPTGWTAPLLGRQFFHGVLDCYTLVRDWYAREAGIQLLDFERADDWWNNGQDLYMQGFVKTGFARIPDGAPPQPGDVVLMSYRSPVANHAGIYLGTRALAEAPGLHPVPHAMLHHLYGRLSERVVYGGHWQEITRAVVRHKDFKA
ncbi:MAG: C40 family peptidase [Comamonas sp.]|jgi:cell wall-associated NlpC family hydrolase|nr:C40 family peptidase [Comamonas sp.]